MFSGFPREMPAFFAALRFNNNRTFFEENRAIYERAVRDPLIALSEALAPTARELDPLLDTRPGRSVSRIYRDVRFRKDKSPYRDYMWIGYRRTGETCEDTCGFYFDLSDTSANWGCGYYHAQQGAMRRLREIILQKPESVQKIVEKAGFAAEFELMGDAYVRQHQPPEGMPASLAMLYQKKNIYAEHHMRDLELLHSPELADHICEGFRTLAPFYGLLRECLTKTAEEVYK